MNRKAYLDVAKFYGMALVFYGHMWSADEMPSAAVLMQNRFIYSFHMPLFFALSGATSKATPLPFERLMRRGIATRLLPAIFFSLIMVILMLGLAALRPGSLLADPLVSFLRIFSGHPYSAITWFLVCLMMTEVYDFFIKAIARTPSRVLLAATGFLAAGLLIVQNIEPIARLTGVPKNFWYVHEAMVAVFFYELGYFAMQRGWFARLEQTPWAAKLAVMLIALLATGSFLLNDGGADRTFKTVLMVTSQHGAAPWFLVAAIAGSVFIIALSTLTPPHRMLTYFGTHTLALLGLNEVFRAIVNPSLLRRVPPWLLEGHPWSVTLSLTWTVVSLLLCVPFIWAFDRYYDAIWRRPIVERLLRWGAS